MHAGQQTALRAGNGKRTTRRLRAAADTSLGKPVRLVSQSHSRRTRRVQCQRVYGRRDRDKDDGRVGKMELTAQSKLPHCIERGQSHESLALSQQMHFAHCFGNVEVVKKLGKDCWSWRRNISHFSLSLKERHNRLGWSLDSK